MLSSSQEAAQILVAVCTFGSKGDVSRTLASLTSQRGAPPFDILVVDNNPDGCARESVLAHPGVSYLHVRRPGIAAARNAAVSEAGSYEWLAFIDDDEYADLDWLAQLVEGAKRFRADVVAGPVRPHFACEPPQWIRTGGFFESEERETGCGLTLFATNNVLIRVRTIRELGQAPFNEGYSITGGSDSELSLRLARKGAVIAWSNEAWVTEVVGAQRLTFRWILRRAIREGNNTWRLGLAGDSRPTAFIGSFSRIVAGGIELCGHLLVGRGVSRRGLIRIGRGFGIALAVLNRNVQEYAR